MSDGVDENCGEWWRIRIKQATQAQNTINDDTSYCCTHTSDTIDHRGGGVVTWWCETEACVSLTNKRKNWRQLFNWIINYEKNIKPQKPSRLLWYGGLALVV